MIDYGFTKELDISFGDALTRVKDLLFREGFSVLTSIDIKEKFKEKLGVDFRRYTILGACNPEFAHKAIMAEENIGLMLPCNVIVYEKENKTVLCVIRPTVAMHMIPNRDLSQIALIVEAKLRAMFDAV